MYIRPSTTLLSVIALAGAVSAAPTGGDSSQCNTGSIHCCNSVQDGSSTGLVSSLLGLLGLTGITGQVGLSCVGLAGTGGSCNAEPVCCTGNSFSGLIVIGCSPINIL